MTLRQLSADYRRTADRLQERILLVRELPVSDVGEAIVKHDRLRLLEAMRRDARDMAMLCERYYDRNYRRNARYTL